MKATLGLEFIGANNHDYLRGAERLMEFAGVKLPPDDKVRGGPWVAELYRDGAGCVRPRFIPGRRDYSKANSKGSRGVMLWFVLEQDRLYWVQEPRSWRDTVRYHVAVTAQGDVRKLSKEEVAEWQSAL